MESEQQAPMTVRCGRKNANQDVSIRLFPKAIDQQQVTNLSSREPLAVLKVHSTRLKKHSKYFQVRLCKRKYPDAPPSREFDLELIHGLQVASYTACFSLMYTPLRKNFIDFKSSLQLLRIASQIEFLELVNSTCRYLSTILWSEQDELRIRQFSSSPDFPCSHAEDLVARLQIGEHGNEDYREELLSGQIAESIRIALCPSKRRADRESFLSAQGLFEDLFGSIGQSEIDSAFDDNVVTIVSKEVKEVLESFHEDCRKHASVDSRPGEGCADIDVERVSGFEGKLKALCWALELLVKTHVAEEVVECLLHLECFSTMIKEAHVVYSLSKPVSERVSVRFAKLVISIFRDVAGGRLLLKLEDRVLLFDTWKYVYDYHDRDTQNDILVTWGFGQAVEDLFLTFPFNQQMEALKKNKFSFHGLTCRSSLITLIKTYWPIGEEELLLLTDNESRHAAEVLLTPKCPRHQNVVFAKL